MKLISNLNHFQQLLFHTFPPPLDQTRFLRWAGAKVSSRVTLGMSGAGVVCHML